MFDDTSIAYKEPHEAIMRQWGIQEKAPGTLRHTGANRASTPCGAFTLEETNGTTTTTHLGEQPKPLPPVP